MLVVLVVVVVMRRMTLLMLLLAAAMLVSDVHAGAVDDHAGDYDYDVVHVHRVCVCRS